MIVRPPKLDGKRAGVLGTRAPHRPNPVGMTVARLVKIENDTLFLNGTDLVNGTPVFVSVFLVLKN
jgi:tRNA (Thr-GGU) A37 N-methylase